MKTGVKCRPVLSPCGQYIKQLIIQLFNQNWLRSSGKSIGLKLIIPCETMDDDNCLVGLVGVSEIRYAQHCTCCQVFNKYCSSLSFFPLPPLSLVECMHQGMGKRSLGHGRVKKQAGYPGPQMNSYLLLLPSAFFHYTVLLPGPRTQVCTISTKAYLTSVKQVFMDWIKNINYCFFCKF